MYTYKRMYTYLHTYMYVYISARLSLILKCLQMYVGYIYTRAANVHCNLNILDIYIYSTGT